MKSESKLMEMLVGYAASHQHPLNVGLHLVGIPTIMLGVFIPLSWLELQISGVAVTGAHLVAVLLFLFYLSLDAAFALVFLVLALAVAELAIALGGYSLGVSGGIAAMAFFGGYAAQFVGHAVEKSMPVLVRHPIQAHVAAPFFVVVEVFGLLGLRRSLFDSVQREVAERRSEEAAATS
ncbi:MAG: Mpo1-like protein [Woeseiaceae bacterium]|nr:Mpo1-like protein [Woeseiaceae bacterium]